MYIIYGMYSVYFMYKIHIDTHIYKVLYIYIYMHNSGREGTSLTCYMPDMRKLDEFSSVSSSIHPHIDMMTSSFKLLPRHHREHTWETSDLVIV